MADRAPLAVTLVTASVSAADHVASDTVTPATMLSLVEHVEPSYQAVLQDWLAGVYILDSDADVAKAVGSLQRGECLVNQYGDIYTRQSVTYFGEQSVLHGVLERQTRLVACRVSCQKRKQN